MNQRYSDFIGAVLPEFDLDRLQTGQSREEIVIKTDFASECSHNSYLHALYHQSWPIGEYTGKSNKPSN